LLAFCLNLNDKQLFKNCGAKVKDKLGNQNGMGKEFIGRANNCIGWNVDCTKDSGTVSSAMFCIA
jgi:hypothetical protein